MQCAKKCVMIVTPFSLLNYTLDIKMDFIKTSCTLIQSKFSRKKETFTLQINI